MAVSAVVQIEQYDSISFDGTVSDRIYQISYDGNVRDDLATAEAETTFTHLPHVSQPASRGAAVGGWGTEDPEDWSDSPVNDSETLYRHRFAYGRDRAEDFTTGHTPDIINTPPDTGARWGDLDGNSAVLMYERDFPVTSDGWVRQFTVEDTGSIRNSLFHNEVDFNMTHLGETSSEFTLTLFPFVLQAVPAPYSIKNPTDTNVFIRLSNYAHTIASGTITMTLNGTSAQPLVVDEFFTGLGGYDVTWNNALSFEYDSVVSVIVEFSDTDVPANKITIDYPFYIVKDLAAPRILNIVPADGSEDITPLGTIQFELIDYESGVDLETFRLYVNNILIIDGVHGTITYTAREDELGYTISYSTFEPWLYGDEIPVAVFVKDTSPSTNELFHSYSFKVLESTSPRMININPAACDDDVPTGTAVSVDVVDGGHGIDKDSVSVSVDDIERSGDVTVIPIVHRDE
jgi:hypothetical protein